jgi:hypothetical protein
MFDWLSFIIGLVTTILIETIVIILVSEPIRQGLFRLLSRIGNTITNPTVEAEENWVYDVEKVLDEVESGRPNRYLREQVATTLRAGGLAPAATTSKSVEFDMSHHGSLVRCRVTSIDDDPGEHLAVKVSLRLRIGYRTLPRDLFGTVGLQSKILEALALQVHLRPRGWGIHIGFPREIRPMMFVNPGIVDFVSGKTLDKDVRIRVGQRSLDAEGIYGDSLEKLLKTVISKSPKGGEEPS